MQQRKTVASLASLRATKGQLSIASVTVLQLLLHSEITRLLASEVTYGMLQTCGEITVVVR
jgi:hypothetical protein